jgi:HlyD family secretion protein
VFVPAPDNGQVSDITVQAGDVITAGQVVAHLTTAAEPLDVTSAVNGRVNSVRVDRGAPVDTGTPLISIESFDRDKPQQEVVIYVPFEDRQRIREGMDAQVLPSTVELEKYGYMQGDVRSVARFAATRQEMLAVLNDPSFVERLAATGQLFEVRIALRTDDDGQVIWSTSDGPAASIVSGTPCLVTIQIDQERPISKIFNLSD